MEVPEGYENLGGILVKKQEEEKLSVSTAEYTPEEFLTKAMLNEELEMRDRIEAARGLAMYVNLGE